MIIGDLDQEGEDMMIIADIGVVVDPADTQEDILIDVVVQIFNFWKF